MSNASYLSDKGRDGYRVGHDKITDHMFLEGLKDTETGLPMGVLTQEMANKKNYSREQQDDIAIRSLTRAQTAIHNGDLKNETIAVNIKSRKGEVIIDQDENPFNAKIDKILNLQPVIVKDDTITTANSSSIIDGASAFVVGSAQYAHEKILIHWHRLKFMPPFTVS